MSWLCWLEWSYPLLGYKLLTILSIEHLFSMSTDFFYIFDGKSKKSKFSTLCRLLGNPPPAPMSMEAICIGIFENFNGILSNLRGTENRINQPPNRPLALPTQSRTSMDLWGLLQVWLYTREMWLLDGVLKHVDIENIDSKNIAFHQIDIST